jgi:hypothetical protein
MFKKPYGLISIRYLSREAYELAAIEAFNLDYSEFFDWISCRDLIYEEALDSLILDDID